MEKPCADTLIVDVLGVWGVHGVEIKSEYAIAGGVAIIKIQVGLHLGFFKHVGYVPLKIVLRVSIIA